MTPIVSLHFGVGPSEIAGKVALVVVHSIQCPAFPGTGTEEGFDVPDEGTNVRPWRVVSDPEVCILGSSNSPNHVLVSLVKRVERQAVHRPIGSVDLHPLLVAQAPGAPLGGLLLVAALGPPARASSWLDRAGEAFWLVFFSWLCPHFRPSSFATTKRSSSEGRTRTDLLILTTLMSPCRTRRRIVVLDTCNKSATSSTVSSAAGHSLDSSLSIEGLQVVRERHSPLLPNAMGMPLRQLAPDRSGSLEITSR
jgi:hypothetical protein